MASVIDNAFDAIEAGVVALTPPASTVGAGRAYVRSKQMSPPAGLTGHRAFWFEVPTGGQIAAFGMTHALVEYDAPMRVRLSSVGVPIDRLPSWVVSHAIQVLNRINRLTALGPGIRSIRASRFDVVQLADLDDEGAVIPSGDLDIIVSLQVRAEESDG